MNGREQIEKIEYRRPAGLPGLEVVWAENCGRRWRVFHETYTVSIGIELRGPEFEWRYRRFLYRSDGGKLMLMEPGEIHANTKVTPSADFRVALIDPILVQRAAAELGLGVSTPHLRTGYAADPLLFAAFARLHNSIQDEASLLERQSRLAGCIRLLLERYAEKAERALDHAKRPALDRARRFIEEHFADNFTLEDLAHAAELSRFHLVRAFVAEFGLPPHAFQLRLRLERGRLLLGNGQHASAVASELGFADQSHFARHFVNAYWVSPGAYRNQVGATRT